MESRQIQQVIQMARASGATRLILFGSALTAPTQARDLDLACEGIVGWQLYALAARMEEELGTSVDLIPLTPATRFTRWIEAQGRVLYEG